MPAIVITDSKRLRFGYFGGQAEGQLRRSHFDLVNFRFCADQRPILGLEAAVLVEIAEFNRAGLAGTPQ